MTQETKSEIFGNTESDEMPKYLVKRTARAMALLLCIARPVLAERIPTITPDTPLFLTQHGTKRKDMKLYQQTQKQYLTIQKQAPLKSQRAAQHTHATQLENDPRSLYSKAHTDVECLGRGHSRAIADASYAHRSSVHDANLTLEASILRARSRDANREQRGLPALPASVSTQSDPAAAVVLPQATKKRKISQHNKSQHARTPKRKQKTHARAQTQKRRNRPPLNDDEKLQTRRFFESRAKAGSSLDAHSETLEFIRQTFDRPYRMSQLTQWLHTHTTAAKPGVSMKARSGPRTAHSLHTRCKIEKIVAKKRDAHGKFRYRVRFAGYGPQRDLVVPPQHVPPKLIAAFENLH